MTIPGGQVLDALRSAIQSADRKAVLTALLDLWQRWPLAAVQQAIDAQEVPLLRLYHIENARGWHMIADKRDPRAVPSLVAPRWRADKPSAVRKRLKALARFPKDPRIAAFALAIHAQPGDRPGTSQMQEAARQLAALHHPQGVAEDWPGQRLEELLERAGSLREMEEHLLARVHADLDDDGARLVYADWLLGQEDPLGEFIAQALRPSAARLPDGYDPISSQQRARWVRKLLGPNADPDRIQFSRGLPSLLVVTATHTPEPHPSWGTLEVVRVDSVDQRLIRWLPSLRALPGLRLLEAVDGRIPNRWVLDALPSLSELRVPELRVGAQLWSAEHGRGLDWPLARLWLRGETRGVDLAHLGERTQPLELVLVGHHALRRVVELLSLGPGVSAAHALAGPAEQVERARLAVSLQRDGTRWHATVRADWGTVGSLAEFVRGLQPEAVSSVSIETPHHAERAFQLRARRALLRFRALPTTFGPTVFPPRRR